MYSYCGGFHDWQVSIYIQIQTVSGLGMESKMEEEEEDKVVVQPGRRSNPCIRIFSSPERRFDTARYGNGEEAGKC